MDAIDEALNRHRIRLVSYPRHRRVAIAAFVFGVALGVISVAWIG